MLTNEYFFVRRLDDEGTLPSGDKQFASRIPGCIIVPVKETESSKVFTLIMENHADLTIRDPQVSIGFPKEWKIGLNSNKWEAINGGIILYEGGHATFKYMPTNIQFFATTKSLTLYPFDTAELPPITNLCPLQYQNGSIKGGLIEVGVRMPEFKFTDYNALFAANVFFVPASSNLSKPLVFSCSIDKDGRMIPPTDRELEIQEK